MLLCHAFRWSYQVTVSLTSCSILTASQISSLILLVEGLCFSLLYMRQAKSQCKPSSLLISSLENVKPGIRPLWDKGIAVSIKKKWKMLQAGHQGVETSYSVNRTLLKHLCTWYNPYKNLWLQYACCSMHAAYVLLLVLHTCRLHICAAYAWVHARSMWVGRHKLVLCAPRFSVYVQHTSACMWICVTWMQHARIWQKDVSSMCAAFL